MFSILQQNLVYKVCKIEVSHRLPMGAFRLLVFSFHGVFGRMKSISVIVPNLVDEGLTLETSAFQIFHGGNSTFINSFDKTKFLTLTILARFCAIEVGLSLTFVSSSRRIAESASVIVS